MSPADIPQGATPFGAPKQTTPPPSLHSSSKRHDGSPLAALTNGSTPTKSTLGQFARPSRVTRSGWFRTGPALLSRPSHLTSAPTLSSGPQLTSRRPRSTRTRWPSRDLRLVARFVPPCSTGRAGALARWRAGAAGKQWLRLDAWSRNADLHRYYERRGFQPVRLLRFDHRGSGALYQRPAGSL